MSKALIIVIENQISYGIEAERIREILVAPSVTAAPNQPRQILGVCNYKSQVIPVVSLRILSGEAAAGAFQVCVVVESGQQLIGLAVSQLGGMLEAQEAEAFETSEMQENRGVLRVKEVLCAEPPVFVLDIDESFKRA